MDLVDVGYVLRTLTIRLFVSAHNKKYQERVFEEVDGIFGTHS